MKNVAIIGGGISGLSALHFFRTRYPDLIRPVLLEKESRLGGTIGTDRIDGYISDWGPNGFLDKIPLTLDMIEELGLSNKLKPADSASGNRFIYRHGRLNAISASPLKFMSSPLLSFSGRLRCAAEPFIKGKTDWDNEETIYGFAARRIGREAAETLIEPMVSGIFGGDARKLSLASCFPIMVAMEKDHGSLVKAMIARRKQAKKQGKGQAAGPAGPAGHLTSFEGGLNTIIETMQNIYGEYIRTGCGVTRVDRLESGYSVTFDDGSNTPYDGIVCAAPAYAAAAMLDGMDTNLAHTLASIPYASIAVVCLGYRREDIGHDLDGFGFLIPRSEGKRILGSIWTSTIFPGSAPEGMIQLRTMVGGATDPEAASLSDGALLDIVTGDLKAIVDITGQPAYIRIFKWDKGIPQFILGHPDTMRTIAAFEKTYPGLAFAGNAYDGVGLNDCIVRSERVVGTVAEYLSA